MGHGIALSAKKCIISVMREDNFDGSSNEAMWLEIMNKKGYCHLVGSDQQTVNRNID